MTREEARQVERQLRKRYPGCTVDVTRVFGGVEVAASDGRGWVFLRTADDSPLLALLGAAPETEPGDLPRAGRPAQAVTGPLTGRPAARRGGAPRTVPCGR